MIGSSRSLRAAAANSSVRDSSSSSRCGRLAWWKIREADDHSCSTVGRCSQHQPSAALIRGRVRLLMPLTHPARHQVPLLVRVAGAWLVPACARPQLYSCGIQQRG